MNYLILFITAFVAATLIPAQSETVLLGMFLLGEQSPILLLVVATIGNVLGSIVNWYLGRKIETYQDRSWFPVSKKHLKQAQKYYQKYGSFVLLFSWLPIIGDPITLVSGVLKEKFLKFLLLVILAKGGRYFLIYLSYLGVITLY